MIIKRNKQCTKCREYNYIYVRENQNIKGLKIKCKCGNIEECVSDFRMVTKWRIVK